MQTPVRAVASATEARASCARPAPVGGVWLLCTSPASSPGSRHVPCAPCPKASLSLTSFQVSDRQACDVCGTTYAWERVLPTEDVHFSLSRLLRAATRRAARAAAVTLGDGLSWLLNVMITVAFLAGVSWLIGQAVWTALDSAEYAVVEAVSFLASSSPGANVLLLLLLFAPLPPALSALRRSLRHLALWPLTLAAAGLVRLTCFFLVGFILTLPWSEGEVWWYGTTLYGEPLLQLLLAELRETGQGGFVPDFMFMSSVICSAILGFLYCRSIRPRHMQMRGAMLPSLLAGNPDAPFRRAFLVRLICLPELSDRDWLATGFVPDAAPWTRKQRLALYVASCLLNHCLLPLLMMPAFFWAPAQLTLLLTLATLPGPPLGAGIVQTAYALQDVAGVPVAIFMLCLLLLVYWMLTNGGSVWRYSILRNTAAALGLLDDFLPALPPAPEPPAEPVARDGDAAVPEGPNLAHDFFFPPPQPSLWDRAAAALRRLQSLHALRSLQRWLGEQVSSYFATKKDFESLSFAATVMLLFVLPATVAVTALNWTAALYVGRAAQPYLDWASLLDTGLPSASRNMTVIDAYGLPSADGAAFVIGWLAVRAAWAALDLLLLALRRLLRLRLPNMRALSEQLYQASRRAAIAAGLSLLSLQAGVLTAITLQALFQLVQAAKPSAGWGSGTQNLGEQLGVWTVWILDQAAYAWVWSLRWGLPGGSEPALVFASGVKQPTHLRLMLGGAPVSNSGSDVTSYVTELRELLESYGVEMPPPAPPPRIYRIWTLQSELQTLWWLGLAVTCLAARFAPRMLAAEPAPGPRARLLLRGLRRGVDPPVGFLSELLIPVLTEMTALQLCAFLISKALSWIGVPVESSFPAVLLLLLGVAVGPPLSRALRVNAVAAELRDEALGASVRLRDYKVD